MLKLVPYENINPKTTVESKAIKENKYTCFFFVPFASAAIIRTAPTGSNPPNPNKIDDSINFIYHYLHASISLATIF